MQINTFSEVGSVFFFSRLGSGSATLRHPLLNIHFGLLWRNLQSLLSDESWEWNYLVQRLPPPPSINFTDEACSTECPIYSVQKTAGNGITWYKDCHRPAPLYKLQKKWSERSQMEHIVLSVQYLLFKRQLGMELLGTKIAPAPHPSINFRENGASRHR